MGRAIHLEIVENRSAEAFLPDLRRFVSHHGWLDTFISDSGKCFVGAEKELKKLLSEGRSDINDFAVPHSALIKQSKRALRSAIANQVLSWNEMATVFAEVNSLINSRPPQVIQTNFSSSKPPST